MASTAWAAKCEENMKQIIIDGISIELEKKKIKNMYLRILPPDGRAHISAPLRMKEEEIRAFVLSRMDWVREQQTRMRQRHTQTNIQYKSGERVLVWGKAYTLNLKENSSNNQIELNENIVLSVKGSNRSADELKKLLDHWYRVQLEKEALPLIERWERIIGVKTDGLRIRDMKTRWGTCNIRSKIICLNLQLAKKPLHCLEYVVVHELVHLLEGSHNKIFKGYMDHFLPQWRQTKKELNT